MRIYASLHETIAPVARGVAIGTFDGVHLGHQELLRRLVMRCRSEGLVPTVFTFSTHPDLVFRAPQDFTGYLMDEKDRLAAFEDIGIEDVFLMPLTPEIYELSAEQFLVSWMKNRLQARLIAVGNDARFGAGKTGGTTFLLDWSARHGVEALIVDDVMLEGEKVSSTRCRQALLDKNVQLANRMLTHPYRLNGMVVRGRNLGSKYGVPTANIGDCATRLPLPHGVYVARTKVDGRWYDAVANIGLSPTIDRRSTEVRIEAHLFDFSDDLYGKTIVVDILHFLRDELTFDNFAAMMPQIEQDRHDAKAFLKTSEQPVERESVHGIPFVEIDTDRFAFGQAALIFRRRAVKGQMAAYALLLRMMARRSKQYPEPSGLEQALALLGDAMFSPIISQEGDVQVLGLMIQAMETDHGGRRLADAITLLFDACFNVFFDFASPSFMDQLEHEKRQLINVRLTEDEDRIEHAIRLSLNAVLGDQPHALHLLGEIAEIERVTPADLWSAFDALVNDAYAAFYVSADMTAALRTHIVDALQAFQPGNRLSRIQSWPLDAVLRQRPPLYVQDNTTEHIVVHVLSTGSTWYEQARWADYLFDELLGGGQHSLLFATLRDEKSLCYQVFSLKMNVIGITMLVAATTKSQAEAVKSGMEEVYLEVAHDRVADEAIETARRFVDQALTAQWDRASQRLYTAINWHVYGQSANLDDKRSFLQAVSREDVIRVAHRANALLWFELAGVEDGD